MSNKPQTKDAVNSKTKKNNRPGTGFIILLAVILILFLLSTIILGSRLYEMATRDQYTVDITTAEPICEIELFRIEYANDKGEITVRGVNADNVVAPGTTADYDIRLRNNDEIVIEFLMMPTVEFLTDDEVLVEFKMVDDYGNYILGSDTEWADAADMNNFVHKGNIYPGEVFTYHFSWRWVFEVDDERDAYDTYLGSQTGMVVPGVSVGITTEAMANAYITTKDITHVTHLRGESFGCCWCCWLVWLLLLVVLVLVIWIWKLNKKIKQLEEVVDEYEENMNQSDMDANI